MYNLDTFQVKVLRAIAATTQGELSLKELKALYKNPHRSGDGNRIARLNRMGLTEWRRLSNNPNANAVAIQITENGRAAIKELVNA